MSDNGFFDRFGGKYVAEVLRRPLDELEVAFKKAMADPEFLEEFRTIQRDYIGRETPLYFAPTATRILGGAKIYIKLEGLANTGAHKSITQSVSASWRSTWGKSALLRRLVPDSMVLLLPLPALSLAWTALFIWARSMFAASSRMLPAWKCTGQRFTR